MSRYAYRETNFRPATLEVIERANIICNELAEAGYTPTLRQLFYQFVARGWLPNTQQNYKSLGGIINDARLAGLIDWDHIVDTTRNLRAPNTWDSPAQIMAAVANQYRIDRWEGQPTYVEVWVEKDALASVISRAANEWDVPWFSCRGNVSQSEMRAAGRRLMREVEHNDRDRILILHLGDHDPNGLDMTRDIEARLTEFMEHTADRLEVRRIALNMAQVEELGPPPNPVKLTDSRSTGYIDRFGTECWELDALPPQTLHDLITNEIAGEVDMDMREERFAVESREQGLLAAASRRWPELEAMLS